LKQGCHDRDGKINKIKYLMLRLKKFMTRKDFLSQAGAGAAGLLLPMCLGSLSGCSPSFNVPAAPTNVDFTLDVSTGALAAKGGYLSTNGLVVAHTTAGTYIAVSAACTHQGTTVQYIGSSNSFYCANHGATYNAAGQVTRGPASQSLAEYKTTLTGTSLRVYS
jgi:cytochrome b6-f complex iron-sulfur subunit